MVWGIRMKSAVAVLFLLVVAAGLAVAGSEAKAQERGKVLARGCVCHRGDLDAMPAKKFVEKMLDFKTGKRTHNVMNKQASRLTEQEIEDLAAWFAGK